jgi:hypothetical protein
MPDIVDADGNPKPVRMTDVVFLNPSFEPVKDPSNESYVAGFDRPDHKGRERKSFEAPVRQGLNVMLRDFDNGGRNVDVVFDREAVKDGLVHSYAVVPSAAIRCQLAFQMRKDHDGTTAGFVVDRRFIFADRKQQNRLREYFLRLIYKPNVKTDRKVSEYDKE